MGLFKEVKKKVREDGVVVTEYEPQEELYIDAIDPVTGESARKKILKFTKHENLKTFCILDPYNRFKTFWVSSDHALIVYDSYEEIIKKATVEEVLKDPERYYLIQKEVE